MGPYHEILAPVLAEAFTLAALAAVLKNNGDRREKEKLCSSKAKMVGLFMVGVISIPTGNITIIVLPQPTAGYEECCAKTTKEEKFGSLKHMLDLRNKARN